MVSSLQKFKHELVFRIYERILGHCMERNLDFEDILLNKFGHKKLVDLIGMIKEEKISSLNAREVVAAIFDGDERMPGEIAEELGFVGEVRLDETIRSHVDEVF